MQSHDFSILDASLAAKLLLPRPKEGHKGDFGHMLFIGGHHAMMGAALLSCTAALRSGVGKLTAHVPETANFIFQTQLPEAILDFDQQSHEHWASPVETTDYTSIAIGPGLGTDGETAWALRCQLKMLLDQETTGAAIPLVLDADAINLLAQDYQLLSFLPTNSILTPHIGEMKRLCAALDLPHHDAAACLDAAQSIASSLQIHIVLKSHQTHCCLNNGEVFQLATRGNSGMAKAGSGDVLTGIIGSLLAQGYAPSSAALLGCFLHHQAGEIATINLGAHSTLASDFIQALPHAFLSLSASQH